jgi:peptidoglycan hydrolase-like protein with peptidoglycan-binding domain
MNRFVMATLVALPLALAVPAMAQQGGAAPQPSGQGAAVVRLNQDQIRQLQQALNDNGFDAGKVDGVMGASTSAALKRFQSKAGLQPTGQIDQQTLALVGLSGQAQPPSGQSTGQGGASQPPAKPDESTGRGEQGGQQDSPGPQNERGPERQ